MNGLALPWTTQPRGLTPPGLVCPVPPGEVHPSSPMLPPLLSSMRILLTSCVQALGFSQGINRALQDTAWRKVTPPMCFWPDHTCLVSPVSGGEIVRGRVKGQIQERGRGRYRKSKGMGGKQSDETGGMSQRDEAKRGTDSRMEGKRARGRGRRGHTQRPEGKEEGHKRHPHTEGPSTCV